MKRAYQKPKVSRCGVLSGVTAAPPGSNEVIVSDVRLKTDIERVGTAANGLPLYTFRYVGGDALYRGVMAQDVLRAFPEAVCAMPDGYLAVRYDMLGIEMPRVH